MKIYIIIAALWAQACWPEPSSPVDPYVTIWVHGTKLTPTLVYANFFYRMPGMHSAKSYEERYHKRQTAELLCQANPEQYSLEQFYFFGWNGKLCFKERKKASQDLYNAILKLILEHEQQYGKKPKIRIITHSHGGNVVLNLARHNQNKQLVIDELIMLGCPVQENTKHLIEADCFKRIYSFYSGSDIFQIIDPQGLYKKSKSKKIFSERRFNHQNKLRQAHVKSYGRSVMHVEFLCFPFLRQLPVLCQQIDQFYANVQEHQYEKIMDIKTKDGNTYIINKLNMRKAL
jgi:hypothetical protein